MGLYYLPESKYTRRKSLDSLVVHCSDTYAGQEVTASDIRGWHTKERGWIDIGYHAVITRVGALEIGRPWWAQGAGVAGWNADSFHICMVGGRKAGTGPGTEKPAAPEDNFTPDQYTTLRSLIITLREMDPGAERVLGHRDYPGVPKYCPSFDVAAWCKKVGLSEG